MNNLVKPEEYMDYPMVIKDKPEKFWYYVSLSAEGFSSGYVELTKEEAEVVDRVTNPANWKYRQMESWSGSFFINTNDPKVKQGNKLVPAK